MPDYGYQPRSATTDSTIPPHFRIRNEHSHTLKDGWRLSSTTVEFTYSLGTYNKDDVKYMIEEMQRRAFEAGQKEADLRNQEGSR